MNRVISASQKLGYDGRFVLNIYPERATNAKNMQAFSKELHYKSLQEIESALRTYQIKEVWGAWGDLKIDNLK